jgi:ABC-type uncharacterized transport system substrate-binding protein
LHELVPGATTVGVLLNPLYPPSEQQSKDLQVAALSLGLKIEILRASNDREIDTAFESVPQRKIAALQVAALGALRSSHWLRSINCRRSISSVNMFLVVV